MHASLSSPIGSTFLVGIVLAVALSFETNAQEASTDLDARITKLIEQLGADEFATREKAQSRIKALGLAAFEPLLAATKHRDIEVASRVRYLLRGMPVGWSRDSDPPAVRSILRNYDKYGRGDRENRMQLLAGLEDSQGVEALCRIVRYEVDPILSKKAALLILGHRKLAQIEERASLAETIRGAIENSGRPAIAWVDSYARLLLDPPSTFDAWTRITRDELQVWTKTPDETQRDVVRDLLRWHADLLAELDRPEDAEPAILRTLEVVEGRRDELADIVGWARSREAWFVSEELARRFPSTYWQDAELIYQLADGRRRLGNEAGAQQAASTALALHPRDLVAHETIAKELHRKMLAFDWAEQEYKQAIAAAENRPDKLFQLQYDLAAELLFDLEREQEAAVVMRKCAAVVEKEKAGADLVASLQSTADYFMAMHHGREGEYDKQRELLTKAYEAYPANIDIVIAMYRVKEADKAWQASTKQRLDESVARIRTELDVLEKQYEMLKDANFRRQIAIPLAQKNNELAWLVSNTTGDYEEAVQLSQRSLELRPDAWEYTDTLGRCYYAVENYEEAVRVQKQAVAGAPYMQQMQRQLKLFEDALAEKRKAS